MIIALTMKTDDSSATTINQFVSIFEPKLCKILTDVNDIRKSILD